MKSDDGNRGTARSPKGREARDDATNLFVKTKNADSMKALRLNMARLRALRLAKEAEDKTD